MIPGAPIRTSLQLFRDCMRLVRHIAPGNSPKRTSLRIMVRSQFGAHQLETDPIVIETAKANAVRALANYMLLESGTKDAKIKKAMNDQVTSIMKERENEQNKAESRE